VGIAKLSRATIILPRSEYQEALTYLSQFEDFHRIPTEQGAFDPATEELTVKAVRLFAQTDQAVRSLSVPLSPPMLDVIFRGTRVPQTEFEAPRWKELLEKAELEVKPVLDEISEIIGRLSEVRKREHDSRALLEAISSISHLPVELDVISGMKLMTGVVAITERETLEELRNSLPDGILVSQPLAGRQAVVLIVAPTGEAGRVEKVLRTLEVKPLTLPAELPQSPPEAYKSLGGEIHRLEGEEKELKDRIKRIREKGSQQLLAVRELASLARTMLDEVRNSGKLKRMASLSGFIPSEKEGEFSEKFGKWIVHLEGDVRSTEGEGEVPTLLVNAKAMRPFTKVTESQGTPGRYEVDPTPLISFFFPIFFGMMFGDLGHGLIVTAFGLLLRKRPDENLKQWGTIFTAAGISASIFGTLFGEIFGFSIGILLPVPAALEIVKHSANGASLGQTGIVTIISVALLIGLVHITLGLSLSVYESARAHERLELLLEKIPALVMYIGGVGFGLAFIQAGYSFKGVLSSSLGVVSVLVITPALMIIAFGKGVATITGRLHEDSVAMAFVQGVIELLVRIAEFVANTISYARLAILLLVHAALLLTVNMLYYSYPGYPYIVVFPIAIFNILIILLEGLIVYIQDMRLHLYEWFTKFYSGEGVPFRKILPERERVRIRWL